MRFQAVAEAAPIIDCGVDDFGARDFVLLPCFHDRRADGLLMHDEQPMLLKNQEQQVIVLLEKSPVVTIIAGKSYQELLQQNQVHSAAAAEVAQTSLKYYHRDNIN